MQGLEYRNRRRPRNKIFVEACSLSTVQALYSLTSSKRIRGKSLRIQETDVAEATAVSVDLSRLHVQTLRMKTYRLPLESIMAAIVDF